MAEQKLRLSVVTPEKSLFDEEVAAVTVPAWDGEVGIRPGHARFLARLGIGELKLTLDGRNESYFIEGGFVQVADNRVTVLTDSADNLQDIDLIEAEKRVEGLRDQMRGEDLADAKNRHLTMKRIKNTFESS